MTPEIFLGGKVVLHAGDSRDVLKTLAASSIDSIVTDPPYALVSIGKRFGGENARLPNNGGPTANVYNRTAKGFMGKAWDTGETAFAAEFWQECLRVLKPGGHVVAFSGTRTYHRMACAIEDAGFEVRDMLSWLYGQGFPKSHNAGNGWGTALKPACEPILLGRKPLLEKTIAANVLAHGTGAINVDGCRVGTSDEIKPVFGGRKGEAHGSKYGHSDDYLSNVSPLGRWPANVLHDGSAEVLAGFPESEPSGSAQAGRPTSRKTSGDHAAYSHGGAAPNDTVYHNDSGSAARFFYTSKADSDDRLGSKHPTVKPVDLMQWLCRLVTPPGGTILDPFAGTGTTGEAAFREGFNAVLIEREDEYLNDIRRRMRLVMGGPDERARESIKARQGDALPDHGPLFGGSDAIGPYGRRIYGVFADEPGERE